MGKERVHTTSVPSSVLHAPQAVRSGPFVFVSGLYATDFKTGIAVRSDPTFPFVGKTDIPNIRGTVCRSRMSKKAHKRISILQAP